MPERGEIDQSALVGCLQRLGITVQRRCPTEPLIQLLPHLGSGPVGESLQTGPQRPSIVAQRRDVQFCGPFLVRPDPDIEGHAVLVDLGRFGRRDQRLSPEGFALIDQSKASLLHPGVPPALLGLGAEDLEDIGEVAADLEAHPQAGGLGLVVQHGQLFVEPLAE